MRRLTGLLALFGCAIAQAAAAQIDDGPPFAGQFFAVEARDMSGLAVEDEAVSFDEPAPVRLVDDLLWWDGTECSSWDAQALPPLDVVRADPMLADLFLPPAGEPGMFSDHRRGDTFALSCDGTALATVMRVDDRVLVDVRPDLGRYIIIERDLLYEDVIGIQRALRTAGYAPGPADGAIGPRTRDAIAEYVADRLSIPQPPGAGIVTGNLIDGVAFSAYD